MNKVSAIIVAAGEGKRFGSPKQYALLGKKPVLEWSLERFEEHDQVTEIILVLEDDSKEREYLSRFGKVSSVTTGGSRRQESVFSGFSCIDAESAGIVLVHDGARPFISRDLIGRIIEKTREKGAAVPVVPVDDTIKSVEGEKVVRTEERARLFRSQTPQGFLYSVLAPALVKSREEGFYGTDEASLVERMGKDVFVVSGERNNIKITTSLDLKIAEALLDD
jgi:2-C-methyl-D-erythritol 4-phosphate cytidylyltransferase